MTPEQLARFVADSCEKQGVPVKVTDSRVLADIASLLRADSSSLPKNRDLEADKVAD
jgi:hypothetical protein